METRNLRKSLVAVAIAGALAAGLFAFYSQPVAALVQEPDCPALPTCTSTEYLRVYGWCGEPPENCTMYRYANASSPHCLVCN